MNNTNCCTVSSTITRLVFLLTAIFTFSVIITQALAAVATLTPVQDNTIYGGTEFENYSCGTGTGLFAGNTKDNFARRALLLFDIGATIPVGATINSATLTLVVNRSGDAQDAPMTLHPISDEWGEGTVNCDGTGGGGQGEPANTGDATWLSAQHLVKLWISPGGDFGVASATTLVGSNNNSPATWNSSAPGNAAMVTNVQSWLDNPLTNYGWLIQGDEARIETARRFSSREGNTQPVLTIDFTPPVDTFACCAASGDCSVLAPAVCTAQGGTPNTSTTSCTPNLCPQPIGACCNPDESCSENTARNLCETGGGTFQGAASLCSVAQASCGLAPFVDPLPIPGVVAPIGTRPDGVPQYEISISQQIQQLHRNLPPTTVWTYNGAYPGPTLETTVDQPIEVKFINNLPAGPHYLPVDECSHGPNYWGSSARTVTHLHGGHVPSRFDGQPELDFLPGDFDVYEYPNNQLPATLWYHDHALGITRLNVYMGMAGYYLLRDAVETALGLPSGEFEIPVVVQDRQFNPDGSLSYPATIVNSFTGDKVVVNGKVWPFLNVKQGKYRLRFVNGSQSRLYNLRLENTSAPAQTIPFNLIGTDGGLIDSPIPLNNIFMTPAERFDVVIDFSGFPVGTEIILRNDDTTLPLLPNVMKFIVTNQPGFTAPLPAILRPVTPIPEAEAAGTRRFLLERVTEQCAGAEWLVKSLDSAGNVIGEHWDDITEFPILGTTEIWQFENPSTVTHPMHVHLEMFQVLDKVDLATGLEIPLQPWEINTWKDTVNVPPNSRVRIIVRWKDYLGKFPYHCHILDHEDHEMMRQFQTINNPANCNNNGICELGEDCVSCPDCPQASGAQCGNGLCEVGDGEDCLTCPSDCNGDQQVGTQFCCGNGGINPIGCGVDATDNRCIDATTSHFCRTAPRILACCGDTLCEGAETATSCALDCEIDTDGDGVPDTLDNCPLIANADQADRDGNGIGNVCEPPVVTGVWPGNPPLNQVASILVFGNHFDMSLGGTQVFLNGIQQNIIQVISPDVIVVRALVTSSLFGPVTVTTSNGTATGPLNFGAPLVGLQITSFWPSQVLDGSTVTILIFGNDFNTVPGATQVAVNGVNQTIVQVLDSELILLRASITGALAGPITVTTPAGTATSTESLVILITIPPLTNVRTMPVMRNHH